MKYLISLYFDESTNKQIHNYIKVVAEATGNDYMLANNVPPHITVASFEVSEEAERAVINMLEAGITEALEMMLQGEIQWVGCGAFMNSVLYLTPVLNLYLQTMMECMYDVVTECGNETDIKVSKFYKPYEWLPHTTIGKKMNAEELSRAFETVQGDFRILHGKIIRVGLAKASPYVELREWTLS